LFLHLAHWCVLLAMAHHGHRGRLARELFGTSSASLESYFRLYDNLMAWNEVYILNVDDADPTSPNTITHDDILQALQLLRSQPALSYDQLVSELVLRLGKSHTKTCIEILVQISVRAMLMLDMTDSKDTWRAGERFVDFVSRSFPRASGMDASVRGALEHHKAMKAWKLKARCNIAFKGTDNLARHLLLDTLHPNGPTLYIFQCTAFLKAQLARLRRENIRKEDDLSACITK